MAAPTRPLDLEPVQHLDRFDRVERAVHWINATLMFVLIFTGAALYIGSVGSIFGRRQLMEDIHVYCGIALPAPMLFAVSARWGTRLRADLRRLNRWTRRDRLWLRSILRGRQDRRAIMEQVELGKFNPGQKLNAAFVAGAGLVMLGTGLIMRWYHPWPLSWRTGATFVHDYIALALFVVIAGHIAMAVSHPESMGSMLHGKVSRRWAEKEAPAWVDGRDGPLT